MYSVLLPTTTCTKYILYTIPHYKIKHILITIPTTKHILITIPNYKRREST